MEPTDPGLAAFVVFCAWFFGIFGAATAAFIVAGVVSYCRANGYQLRPYLLRGEVRRRIPVVERLAFITFTLDVPPDAPVDGRWN